MKVLCGICTFIFYAKSRAFNSASNVKNEYAAENEALYEK
jgi:hypothetical protein